MANEIYYPEILTNSEAFPANIMFTFYERQSTSSSSAEDIVHLYMPEQFGQPNTVSWDHEFGGGQAILAAGAGAASIGADITSAISNSKYGTGRIAARISSFKEFMTGAVQKYGTAATDLGTLASLKTGVTLNPYITQMFRGVDLRNFHYTFRLVPFSERDCETILEIIRIFRKWSLPAGGAGGGSSMYLTYPGEVDVQYQWQNGENIYLHRFKRSVITELTIDYTGSGMWTMMRNGFPTETVLQVSFGEIEIIVREDVANGY